MGRQWLWFHRARLWLEPDRMYFLVSVHALVKIWNNGNVFPGLGPRLGCLPRLQDPCDAQVRSDAAGQDGSHRGTYYSASHRRGQRRRYTNLRGMTDELHKPEKPGYNIFTLLGLMPHVRNR